MGRCGDSCGLAADWRCKPMPDDTKHQPLALRVNDAAAACGVGRDELYAAHKRGDLVFRYPTSRPVIEVRELER